MTKYLNITVYIYNTFILIYAVFQIFLSFLFASVLTVSLRTFYSCEVCLNCFVFLIVATIFPFIIIIVAINIMNVITFRLSVKSGFRLFSFSFLFSFSPSVWSSQYIFLFFFYIFLSVFFVFDLFIYVTATGFDNNVITILYSVYLSFDCFAYF